jgi:hypothetical protein
MESYDRLVEKWAPVLNEESAGTIGDRHKKAVTAVVLENTEKAIREERAQASFMTEAAPTNSTSAAANYDPVLISLVRRAMPNMMAYDLAGVQPMTGPTGLIFAMKSLYKTTGGGATSGDEALFNEALTGFSGDSNGTNGSAGPSGLSGVTDSNSDSTINDDRVTDIFGGGMSTANAEGLGSSGAAPASAFR